MNIENDKRLEKIKKGIPTKFEPISLRELFFMKFPENSWIIEKLIPHQGITLISGAPASFKTWLLLKMAIDIAKGESLFGHFECEQNKVLIIDEENHLRTVQKRFQSLCGEMDLPIYYLSQKDFLVSKKDMVENVLVICKEKGINVIFIDSLIRINNAEENDASQMSEVFKSIKYFCQRGKTVIVTHHERKDGAMKSSAQNRLRGSSDIQASVDCHLAIRRDRNDKTKILIEQAKLRIDEEIESFEVTIRKKDEIVEFDYLGVCLEKISKSKQASDVIISILKESKTGLSQKEIIEKVREEEDIGDKSIRKAIKSLIEEEKISEKGGKGNTKICCLKEIIKE